MSSPTVALSPATEVVAQVPQAHVAAADRMGSLHLLAAQAGLVAHQHLEQVTSSQELLVEDMAEEVAVLVVTEVVPNAVITLGDLAVQGGQAVLEVG